MRRLCFLIFFLAPGNGPKSMGSAEGNLAIGDLDVESCECFFRFYWEFRKQNVLYSPLGILIEDKLGVFYKAKETN